MPFTAKVVTAAEWELDLQNLEHFLSKGLFPAMSSSIIQTTQTLPTMPQEAQLKAHFG